VTTVDRATLAAWTTSDGVDLVAIERVLTGHPAPLTLADRRHLNALLTYDYAAAQLVAEAMGVTRDAVLQRVARRNRPGPEPA
jgi:hypothetical protein